MARKVIIVARIELPDHADPTTHANAVGQALDTAGVEGEAVISVLEAHNPHEGLESVFSKADPDAPPTIPYQERATLKVSEGSIYMDVIGNDGKVIASFEKPDVRRAWAEMNRG